MNKTINISMPEELQKLAQAQVKAGYYTSISEVIRDALRKFSMEPQVPTFKMSQKAEKVALKAKQDYEADNVTEFKDINELLD